MYTVSSLPIFLTLPLALYIHRRPFTNNTVRVESPAFRDENLNNSSPTHAPVNFKNEVQIHDEEANNMARHIDVNFEEEKRVDVVDMFCEEINSTNCSEINDLSDAIASSVTEIINDTPLVRNTIINALLSIAVSIFVQYSLLGVLLKILWKRVLMIPSLPYLLLEKYKSKLLVPAISDSECSDDEFLECQSIAHIKVAREESTPKANQEEEKCQEVTHAPLTDIAESEPDHISDATESVPDPLSDVAESGRDALSDAEKSVLLRSISTDAGYIEGNCMGERNFDNRSFSDEDLIEFDARLQKLYGGSTSTPRSSSPIQEDGLVAKPTKEVTPLKFKRFLHDKVHEISRLGISFDDEGYFIEDGHDESQSSTRSNDVTDSYIELIRLSVRRKLNLFG